VHVAKGLSPEQIKAYRIADNKTSEIAEWNYELLPLELSQLKDANFDPGLLGFDADELAEIMDPGVRDGLTDPDDVPAPPDAAITQPGDLWIPGDHRLLCGDSSSPQDLDLLLDAWFGNASRVLLPGRGFYIWGGFLHISRPIGLLSRLEHHDVFERRLSAFNLRRYQGFLADKSVEKPFVAWNHGSSQFQPTDRCKCFHMHVGKSICNEERWVCRWQSMRHKCSHRFLGKPESGVGPGCAWHGLKTIIKVAGSLKTLSYPARPAKNDRLFSETRSDAGCSSVCCFSAIFQHISNWQNHNPIWWQRHHEVASKAV